MRNCMIRCFEAHAQQSLAQAANHWCCEPDTAKRFTVSLVAAAIQRICRIKHVVKSCIQSDKWSFAQSQRRRSQGGIKTHQYYNCLTQFDRFNTTTIEHLRQQPSPPRAAVTNMEHTVQSIFGERARSTDLGLMTSQRIDQSIKTTRMATQEGRCRCNLQIKYISIVGFHAADQSVSTKTCGRARFSTQGKLCARYHLVHACTSTCMRHNDRDIIALADSFRMRSCPVTRCVEMLRTVLIEC